MYNVNLNLQTTLSIAYIILLLYIISNYVAILIYSCVIIVINYGTLMEQSSEGHTSFNTGALVRGFLVFVGLSILVMAYIVFRSFRCVLTDNDYKKDMLYRYDIR